MIIHHHLGLGDHFVCNGLVNYFSKKQKIDLICKKHNEPTVRSLYTENNNVNIVPIAGLYEIEESHKYAKDTHQDILCIGFNKCDPNNWDKSFYAQVGLNFIERYRLFKFPRTLPPQINIDNKSFIFVHNECSEGRYNLEIDSNLDRFVLEKYQTNNLFSYIDIIQKADEIHCINSSIFHLIDSMSNVTHKLYYHDTRNHPCNFEISSKWSIVDYD
jgi:hypothetical protein